MREYDERIPIVILREEKVLGEALYLGPHMSLIKYETPDGEEKIEWFEEDEYVLYDVLIFKHEEED